MAGTKLNLLCDKIIEAGWLVAAIVIPLFFNFYSNRVFEAGKVMLLRSIALVMAAAWIIKVAEQGPRNWKLVIGHWSLKPLVLPTLLFASVFLLSTLSSVIFRVSFWGSYHRRQGLYVVLCYIVIFFSMLDTLRTRQQLERLITTILLTSLPISLYGIMQRLKLDPLPWIMGGAGRAQSTLGNPILIGAYLIMVIPLTIRELIRSFSLVRDGKKRTVSSLGLSPPVLSVAEGPVLSPVEGSKAFVLLSCYFLLLALQLICLSFTVSRGPLIGLMAGFFFFFLLLAVSKGWKGLALTVIGVAIGLGLFLIALNLPNTPLSPVLSPVRKMPFLARLGAISAHVIERTVIWEGAVEMITADPLRAVVGRGPETMGLTFFPYLRPEWRSIAGLDKTADRCHNETLDVWVTGGLIGFAAYLFLFGSIFYYGLKWLGLIANSRQRRFLIITWLVGGFSGALIPWLMDGTLRWAGVGIPAGILLALVIYLMTSLFQRGDLSGSTEASTVRASTELSRMSSAERLAEVLSEGGKGGVRGSSNQILLITLLSALIAHFVEIQFGIAITATRTYFWLYAALLAIVGYHWQLCPELVEGQRPEPACPELVLSPVEGEEPILEAAAETLPPDSSRQRRGRRRRRRDKLPNFQLLAHSLLVGLILATTSFDLISHEFELRANGPVIFGLLFVVWLLCGIPILTSNFQLSTSNFSTYVLGSLFCFLPFIVAHAAIVLPGTGVEGATVVYYAYIFLVILAVAVALMIGSVQSSKFRLPTPNFRFWILNSGFLVLSFLVLLLIFNTNLKVAQADIYYKFGLSSEETGEIDKAIVLYSRAIQLAPHRDRYYASLGWAYRLKAVAALDANQRVALFEESRKALEHGRQMNPLHPDIAAKFGHVYWNWGVLTPDLEQRAEKLEVALAHYQQAVTLSPLNHGELLNDQIIKTHLHLGTAYSSLGKLNQAVEAYKKASEMAPDNYDSHKNLTVVYLQLGRLDEALEEAKVARDLAPEEEKPNLDDLIAQLEAQKP